MQTMNGTPRTSTPASIRLAAAPESAPSTTIAGDHLVILRRGRLFTVRVGGDALEPVAMTDAYAPGSDPRGAWYDELLISGSTVVVVGFTVVVVAGAVVVVTMVSESPLQTIQ